MTNPSPKYLILLYSTLKISSKGIKTSQPDIITAPQATESHCLIKFPSNHPIKAYIQSRLPLPINLRFTSKTKGHLTYTPTMQSSRINLVNLPTIIESQKIIHQSIYKIADISQMIIVGDTNNDDDCDTHFNENDDVEEFEECNSGITPPLYQCKQKRFKKVVRQQAVKDVEEQVRMLLERAAEADDLEFELLDRGDYEEMRFDEEEVEEEFLAGLEEELFMDESRKDDESNFKIENTEIIGNGNENEDEDEDTENDNDNDNDVEDDEEEEEEEEGDDEEKGYKRIEKVVVQGSGNEIDLGDIFNSKRKDSDLDMDILVGDDPDSNEFEFEN